jgi:FkbM family methyltransferase
MKGASSDPPEVADKLWSGWGGHTAWDVGGHLGESIPQLLELFDRVESFEPATESFAAMALDWVAEPRVGLHRIALSDHEGVLETSVREVCIQSGQLVSANMPYQDFVPGVSSAQTDGLPWGKEIATRVVLTDTVDNFLQHLPIPDFMKIDTEGHEAQVLAGASKLLSYRHTGFLIEFHSESNHDECIKVLEEAEYQVETVHHPHYKPNSKLWVAHGWLRAIPN